MTKELCKEPDERQRLTLCTVLLLNAVIVICFFATGTLGNLAAPNFKHDEIGQDEKA